MPKKKRKKNDWIRTNVFAALWTCSMSSIDSCSKVISNESGETKKKAFRLFEIVDYKRSEGKPNGIWVAQLYRGNHADNKQRWWVERKKPWPMTLGQSFYPQIERR